MVCTSRKATGIYKQCSLILKPARTTKSVSGNFPQMRATFDIGTSHLQFDDVYYKSVFYVISFSLSCYWGGSEKGRHLIM